MAVISGNHLVVYDNDMALGHSTSCAISFNMNVAEATSKASEGWKEVLAGTRQATIKVEALVDYSQTQNYNEWVTQIITRKYTKWVFKDATSFYLGGGYVLSCEQVADFEDVDKYSIEIQIDGRVYVEPRLPWNLVFTNWENVNINWENV